MSLSKKTGQALLIFDIFSFRIIPNIQSSEGLTLILETLIVLITTVRFKRLIPARL
ncbi:MAG: hypothetical protein K0R59_51 [Sphingobacterium sp.]|jgi:hypothetical protein|nr:hypothetical protein [Sphingobacterium sp.]